MRFLDSANAILSPCVGICALNTHGFCEGCHRTTDEIARWMYYTDAERAHLMTQVLPQRAAQELCK